MKVRLTSRVYDHLTGSGIMQYGRMDVRPPHEISLEAKINEAKRLADGSRVIDVSEETVPGDESSEMECLIGQGELLEIGGRDNAETGDGRGDLLAAAAFLRKYGKEGNW